MPEPVFFVDIQITAYSCLDDVAIDINSSGFNPKVVEEFQELAAPTTDVEYGGTADKSLSKIPIPLQYFLSGAPKSLLKTLP